jgi:hypothetical protein
MSDSREMSESFLLAEYKIISQNFSSGFQTMALLLSLFFLYTAAALGYISHFFDNLKPDPVWILFRMDFRYVQIILICFISLIFTFWSQCWVLVYRKGTIVTLARASVLEKNLSQDDRCASFFSAYTTWYNAEKWLVYLYYATGAFFISVYALYCLIGLYSTIRLIYPGNL